MIYIKGSKINKKHAMMILSLKIKCFKTIICQNGNKLSYSESLVIFSRLKV